MSSIFHLAIPAGRLDITVPFYNKILGCKLGPFEKGKWQDVDFWGNELTLHETSPRSNKGPDRERHSVEMGSVCVPHFGIHLSREAFDEVKKRIDASDHHKYLDKPYLRFKDDDREQETFFIRDPSGNALEIKTMKVPESLWEINS